MDEQEFKNRADQALNDLYRRLLAASERHDFEADFGGGALVIEFEAPPAKSASKSWRSLAARSRR